MRGLVTKSVLLLGLLTAPFVVSSLAMADAAAPPPISSKAAELLDGQSGKVIYQKNAYERRPMASVTKIMTLLVAAKALQQKKISLHDMVPVSEEAYKINGSQIWLEPGERLSVDQMMKAIAIGSANDAAYALGEYIAGSEEAFVNQMNQTAQQLGMTSTHFTNPHGLDNPNHYTTAHDLGILALAAIRNPIVVHYTSMWEDHSIRNGKGGTLWLINHNKLLKRYPGTDGIKTGFTTPAGFCIVATAKRTDTRLVVVVLGSATPKEQFGDSAALLTWGFQHYRSVPVATKGTVVGRVAVRRGTLREVHAVVSRDSYLTLPIDAAKIDREVKLPESLEAPIKPGQVLGYMVAKQNGQELARVPIVAQEGAARASWIGNAWHFIWKIAG